MVNMQEVLETNQMISAECLDVRTITMGISLLDCIDTDLGKMNQKIYEKIVRYAEKLVETGEEIGREFGIPIVNKRVSVTPIGLIGAAACKTPDDFVEIAKTLDRAAHTIGINFIGGYSALVNKGMTPAEENLLRSIPKALAETELVCSSVNVGSTKTGINMDAVRLMGQVVRETAEATKEKDSLGCAKLVVFCNAPDDNPFMAGAFHGVTEADAIINVGVSGPGVMKAALANVRGADFEVLCETIKKTAFKITRVGQLVAQEASKRLGVPFGIIDLSLAPTPAIGDSVADILEEIGVESTGAPGTTAALALLNGVLVCRWSLRRLHPGQRGSGHDQCRGARLALHREAGSHDLRLLGRPGHDRDPRGHEGYDDRRHHRGRGGDRHGQPEDHRGTRDPGHRQERGRYRGVRRPARPCADHAGEHICQR